MYCKCFWHCLSMWHTAQKGKLCLSVCLHFNTVLPWYLSRIRWVTGLWIKAVVWLVCKGHNTFLLNHTAPVGCSSGKCQSKWRCWKLLKPSLQRKEKLSLFLIQFAVGFSSLTFLCHKLDSLQLSTGPSYLDLFGVLIGQQKKHVLPWQVYLIKTSK